jgi:predicted nucleic acid-binding protein
LPIVLDTWALVAHLRDEPAAERVRKEWLKAGAAMCSVNLGEALYLELRVCGATRANSAVEAARRELVVIDPDWGLVRAAAEVKAQGGLSYADAFCVAAARHLDSQLWTGDPEIVERGEELGCRVVDLRKGDA